eukprot:jgi/Galph1/4193/GphlegSOOS_G2861.1
MSRGRVRCSLDLSKLEQDKCVSTDDENIAVNCIDTPYKRVTPSSVSQIEVEKALNLFLSYDDDKDGKISVEELRKLLSTVFISEEVEDVLEELSMDCLKNCGIDWLGMNTSLLELYGINDT